MTERHHWEEDGINIFQRKLNLKKMLIPKTGEIGFDFRAI